MTPSKFLKMLVPTLRQALVSLAMSLAILALVFQSLILPRAFGSIGYSPFLEAGKQLELANLNRSAIVRLGVEGLFWAIVGLCAYLVYLGMVNALVEARNEVILTTEFANKGKFSTWARRFWLQLSLLAILVLALWVTASYGLNYWFSLVGHWIIEGYSAKNAFAALGGTIGLTLNIYALWVLSEATITADR